MFDMPLNVPLFFPSEVFRRFFFLLLGTAFLPQSKYVINELQI